MIVWQHQSAGTAAATPASTWPRTIVVGARIFRFADTLDAITSDRRTAKAAAGRSPGRRSAASGHPASTPTW